MVISSPLKKGGTESGGFLKPHTHLPSTSSHNRIVSLTVHAETWRKVSLTVPALVPFQPKKEEVHEAQAPKFSKLNPFFQRK